MSGCFSRSANISSFSPGFQLTLLRFFTPSIDCWKRASLSEGILSLTERRSDIALEGCDDVRWQEKRGTFSENLGGGACWYMTGEGGDLLVSPLMEGGRRRVPSSCPSALTLATPTRPYATRLQSACMLLGCCQITRLEQFFDKMF